MEKVIHCECGFDARARDENGLVAEIQRHAWDAHGMALLHDEALLLVFRAELDERTASPTRSRKPVPASSHDLMSGPEEEI